MPNDTLRFYVLLISLLFQVENISAQFVTVRDNQFYLHQKPYRYVGTNYWYGGFLASDSVNNGKKRLNNELDFLTDKGMRNLRVMLSAEGDSSYPYRIYPSLQPVPRVYNEELLRGFDYFLSEASKRNMKIVFVLSNNWEWSGGFGQYLDWAGYSNPILPKTSNWDWTQYCNYIAQFYSCDSCITWYHAWIKHIVTRQNTITKKYYYDDPTIMAWELANEPRPMKKEAISAYKKWIETSSKYIRSLDSRHLITVGVEGIISTNMDSSLYMDIHRYPSIDYATIHLWPKTWQWYNGESSHAVTDTTLWKTRSYIESHLRWTRTIHKPLVIEEFGMHRDGNRFDSKSTTKNRDAYFRYILDNDFSNAIAGYNFWGAFAYRDARLHSDYWHQGLPYTADPPQEEQGLYGVYMLDTSTWRILEQISKKRKYR